MRILILGGSGMLGHKAFEVLGTSFEVYATFRSHEGLWRAYPFYRDDSRLLTDVDALRFESVTRAFARVRPRVVINCVGIIKQCREAKDPILSLKVNSLFPHQLADLCSAAGARLIHVSTDCVFNGRRGGYRETDLCDAEDLYGRSKCLGEVQREGCLTLRTSIVGWDLCGTHGLLEWFLRQRGKKIQGFSRAVFSGLSTRALAGLFGELISNHTRLEGLYHVSSDPIDKNQLLQRLRQALDLEVEIEPVDNPPVDRSLDSALFRSQTQCRIPSWEEMVAELARDRERYDEWSGFYAGIER